MLKCGCSTNRKPEITAMYLPTRCNTNVLHPTFTISHVQRYENIFIHLKTLQNHFDVHSSLQSLPL